MKYMNKEKNFISVVVYVCNNEKDLPFFMKMLKRLLESAFQNYEIIFVNDNSSDRSVDIIESYAKELAIKSANVINISLFQGLEICMNAGVDYAIGDFVFEFDTVLVDYDDDVFLDVYNKALDGWDIVAAIPVGKKTITSSIFYALFNRYSCSRYRINTERFRVLSRRAINRVKALSKTIPYRKALYVNCGLKNEGVIYRCKKASIKSGNSYYKKGIAVDTLMLFTNLGFRVSVMISILFLLISFFSLLYTIVIYFGLNKPVEGWTTTMLLLSTVFSGVFILLTIIIKYLSLLVHLVFKKMDYLVESISRVN